MPADPTDFDPFAPGRVFCVGVSGSGVRAMAELLHGFRWEVAGTDRAKPDVLARLAARGPRVTHDPHGRVWDERPDFLLHSPAVPESDPARDRAAAEGVPQRTHVDALAALTRRRETIAVAGTHGKSSTAALLTHLLRAGGRRVAGFVGAEPVDPGYSFADPDPELLVVEACEWNRHFLRLEPTHAVVTGVEFDHPDTYEDSADVERAFGQFTGRVPPHGKLLRGEPGESNRDLAVRAAVVLGVPRVVAERVPQSVPALRRRFEVLGEWRGRTVVDDYAHHPAGLTWCRERLPAGGLTAAVAFQPHQVRRTRALLDMFAPALWSWGRAAVLPAYPARESATAADCRAVARDLAAAARAEFLPDLDALLAWADDSTAPGDALILAGAGDIDRARDLFFPVSTDPGPEPPAT